MEEKKPVTMRLIQQTRAFLEETKLGKDARIVCALSGGRDSVCLFHLLKALEESMGFTLTAIHVDHNLRENAKKDAEFCRQLCEENRVRLFLRSVDVNALVEKTGGSVEEAARELRYQAFEDTRKLLAGKKLSQKEPSEEKQPSVWIALAHHQKDQAETVLMHLLRGSGVKGLGGMKAVRGAYLRPLLNTDPVLLDQMVSEQGWRYREDESNEDTRYTRNRIRKELLPLLSAEYNPEIVAALCKTAALSRMDDEFLEKEAECRLQRVLRGESNTLSVNDLLSEPEAMQRRIVVLWLRQNGLKKDQSFDHVTRVLEVAKGRTGRRICLPSSLTLQKSYDILECIRERILDEKSRGDEQSDSVPLGYRLEYMDITTALARINVEDPLQVPANDWEKWMDADRISCAIWRKRQPGDYLHVNNGRKKLKELFIDRKIPQKERDQLWLLADGSHVLWVPGLRMSDAVKLRETTVRVLNARVKKEESNAE